MKTRKILAFLVSTSMTFNVLISSSADIVSADELDDVTLQEVPENSEEPDSATEETESIIEETEAAEEAESVPDETEFTEEVTEEIPEEIAEAIEAAPFNEEAEVDGVIVSVIADEGVFPEGAYMNVERVEDTEDSDALIEETLNDDVNIAHSMTFDITIYDSEGNEIEPDTEAGNVYVSFSDSLVADSNLDVDVYHITDEDEAIALDVNVEDELVVAETDGFSYYVLVFSYETETYNLSRATTVTANEIARSVGLPEGDVSNVIVADGSHINASQTSGIWLISENGSFDGTETVGFVIGGVTYDVEISTNNETTQRATSGAMGFSVGSYGTVAVNCGYNVWGIDETTGAPITTTYDSKGSWVEGSGYRTLMTVDSSDQLLFTDFEYGKTYTQNGVEAYITADFSENGEAVVITYTLTNTNSTQASVNLGTYADCQIGKWDHNGGADGALITSNGTGFSMSYQGLTYYVFPGNGYFSTRWTGFGGVSTAQTNVFNDSIHTNTTSTNDRSMAWSWSMDIPAGETVTRVAVFAIGSDLDTTTVSFDANGGSGSIDPITILDGVRSNLPANTITPPPGGVFSGWATTQNGPVIYPDMGSILADDSMASSITLYAVWQPNAEFTTAPALNSGLVYDGNEKVLIQPGETTQGDIQYSLDGTNWTDNYEDLVATDAGTYRVYYKIIGDDAHTDSAVAYFDVTIEPATLTLIIDDATKVMGQSDPTYTATITGEINAGDADSIEYDISRSDTGEAAGTYTLSATVTESTVPANYTVVIQTGTLTILAVSPTAVDDLTYNGQPQELVTSPDLADFPDGCDEIWYSVDGGTWSQTATSADAGDHEIAFEFRNSNTGTSVNGGTVNVSIERAAITLTADDAGKTFGEDDPADFTASITAGSLYGTDSLDYSVSREAGESAGEYDIVITHGTNTNYNVTVVSGTFTIARAAVDPADLPANNKPTAIGSLVYTGGDQNLLNQPSDTTLNGYTGIQYSTDGVYWQNSVPTERNAGPYTVYYQYVGDANHENIVGSVEVEIAKAPITITVEADQGMVYGGTEPDLTATVEGKPAGGADVNYTLSRAEGTDAGTYAITVTATAEDNPNYEITIVNENSFRIRPASGYGTVTDEQRPHAVDGTITYDGTAHTLVQGTNNYPDGYNAVMYSVGDTENWSSELPSETNAGDYEIHVKYMPADGNHEAFVDTATISVTIAAADVTLTADDAGKTYGEDDPANFTASITSGTLYGTDTLDYSVSRESGENVGDYDINITLGTNNNYNVTVVSGTFNISVAAAPEASDLNANVKPTAIEGLQYTGSEQDLVTPPSSLPTGYDQIWYSTDGGNTWSQEIPTGIEADDYTVDVKYVDSLGNHEEITGVTVPVRIAPADATALTSLTDSNKPTAIEGLQYTGSEQELVTPPTTMPTGYDEVWYSTDGGNTWSQDIPTGIEADDYTVDVKYVDSLGNHEDLTGVTVTATIAPADATALTSLTDSNKPTAIEGLQYTGSEQELVTPPSTMPTGYDEVWYSTDGGNTWSQDIPTGIEADDYTVNVKYVDSLGNHEDLTGVTVTATIAPADATALTSLTDSNKPTAIEGLQYTGSEQELVTPPTTMPAGYDEVWYSTDGGNTWSQDIPTGIEADDYTVDVKYVDSLGNHEDLTGVTVTATIAPADAPALTSLTDSNKPTAISGLTYTGSEQDLVTPPSTMPEGYDEVWYSTDGGNTWSQDIPTGIEADDYTVDVKYVDSLGNHEDLTGVTVPVTIAPATAPAADSLDDSYKPSAIDNLTYTGSEQTLVTPPSALHDGYDQVWFSTDGGDTWSQDLPTGIGADDYTVSVKYVDSLGNHQDLTGVTVPVTIAPAAAPNASDLNANQKPTPISGLTYTGSAQQLVNPPSVKPDNYEQIWYSTDGGNTWSQNLPTGINATDYDISVKYVDTDGNYEDLTGVTVTATINPAASAFAFLTEDNKPHTASGLYYTSNPQVLVVGPSEMPANYETIEYSVDGGNTWVAEPTGTENGNYPVAYRYIDEDGNYQPITGGSLTATIYAAQAPNPSILTDEQKPHAVADLTYDGQSHELVSAPTGTLPNNYEKVMYSTDGGTTWSDAIPAKTSADDYTVNYKYVDTDGAYADLIFPDSIPVSIAPAPAPDVDTLPDDQKPAAIDGLEYTGSAQDLIDRDTPATLPDGYDQIWYSTDGGSTWSQNIPTGTDAGDYEILYKYVDADEDHEDITGGSVTVSIAPADAPSADSLTDANKPSAVDDLAYTGSAQNLVTPPSTLPEGYDQVWYSTDGGNTWSQTIPTGTDAGDYEVSVKYVDSNGNHDDLTGVTVPVTIAPAEAPDASSLTAAQKPTAVNGLAYTGSEQELVNAPSSLPAGYDEVWYSTDGGNTWSQDIPTGIEAGNYTVSVKYVDTDGNYEDLTGITVPVTIAQEAAPELTDAQKPSAVSGLTYTGSAQALVSAPASLPDGYEQVWYSLDGGNTWTQTIPTGTDAGTYTISVRYVDTDGIKADILGSDITVTIAAGTTTAVINGVAQTVTIGSTLARPEDPTRYGYDFTGWFADEACTIPYNFNTPVGVNGVTLYAGWAQVSYSLTEGGESTWNSNSDSTLTFRAVRNRLEPTTFSHFTGIQVDGKDVSKDNYQAKSGSVIVTLNESYLKTLSAGEHTLDIMFDDAPSVRTTFTIVAAQVPSTGETAYSAYSILGALLIASAAAFVIYSARHEEA